MLLVVIPIASPLGFPVPRDADLARLEDGVIAGDDDFRTDGKMNVDLTKRGAQTLTARHHLGEREVVGGRVGVRVVEGR